MLGRMTSTQLLEWMAYEQLEPFGLAEASICAMIANTHRDQKTHPEPFRPRDFALNFSEPATTEIKGQIPKKTGKTSNELKALAQMITAAYNGADESEYSNG